MDLRGMCRWSRLARYGRLPVLRALKLNVTVKLASKMQSKLEMGRNRNQQERIEPERESKNEQKSELNRTAPRKELISTSTQMTLFLLGSFTE